MVRRTVFLLVGGHVAAVGFAAPALAQCGGGYDAGGPTYSYGRAAAPVYYIDDSHYDYAQPVHYRSHSYNVGLYPSYAGRYYRDQRVAYYSGHGRGYQGGQGRTYSGGHGRGYYGGHGRAYSGGQRGAHYGGRGHH